MLEAFVLLAQLVAANPAVDPPGPPPLDPRGVYTTHNLHVDDERELVLTKDATGRTVRALLRRYDGKPMTCPHFYAWISSNYSCTNNCSATYTADGEAGSNVNRYAACSAAREELCAEATCSSGSYLFCSLNYSESGWNNYTGSCSYWEIRPCVVADDCSVE